MKVVSSSVSVTWTRIATYPLPSRFGVRNIPTILFIKNGEVVSKLVGAQSKDVLKKAIEGLL